MIPDTVRQRIFSDESYAIDFYPSGDTAAPSIVITFSEFGAADLNGPGFATQFLMKKGFDVVAVKSLQNKWYADIAGEAINAVNLFILSLPHSYASRSTYGSSMGAYAALIFSKQLNADIAFAISPQFDIALSQDRRWAGFASCNMRRMSAEHVSPRCKYVLLYDPKDEDWHHIDLFHSVIPPEQRIDVQIPYSGHPSGRTLADVGELSGLAVAVLRGEFGSIDLSRLKRRARRSSRFYYNLARGFFRGGKLPAAYSTILRALDANPYHPEYHLTAAKIASAMKQTTRQLVHASAAATLASDNPWIIAYLADFFYDSGQKRLAAKSYRQALALRSNPVWELRMQEV